MGNGKKADNHTKIENEPEKVLEEKVDILLSWGKPCRPENIIFAVDMGINKLDILRNMSHADCVKTSTDEQVIKLSWKTLLVEKHLK